MNKKFFLGTLVLIFLVGFVSAGTYSSSTYQYQSSGVSYDRADYNTYWPILSGGEESCEARTDILLQVSPAGCSPGVVRSDLLAEQNVPVFCQIDALEINPLIDIERIENIRFKGDYPDSVVGSGFHPAKAALRSNGNLLGSPTVNNIGYVTVVLKKNEIEAELPESVNINLTAQVEYSAGNVLGVGNAEFLLEEIDDDNVWEREKDRYSFWQGRYFVRLIEADADSARVALYNGDKIVTTKRIEAGEESDVVYFPGFYCQAGLKIAYDGFEQDDDKVLLAVGEGEGVDRIIVSEGSKFFDNKCVVRRIEIEENGEDAKVQVSCGSERLSLEVERSERIYEFDSGNKVYAGGEKGDFVKEEGEKYIVSISGIEKEFDKSDVIPSITISGGLEEYKGEFENEDLGNLEGEADEAIGEHEGVAIDFPAEKVVGSKERVGENALLEGVNLAIELRQIERARALMELYEETYPDGVYASTFRSELINLARYDYSKSIGAVQIANKFYTIDLIEAIPLAEDKVEAGIKVDVNGDSRDLNLLETESYSGNFGDLRSLKIDRIIDSDRVRLDAVCEDEDGESRRESVTLRLNEVEDVCFSNVKVEKIESNEIAKIRLLSQGKGVGSEVNLSLSIGIEKRGIQLSPERTSEMIDNLNESIDKWTKISDRLGNVVSGLKAACFATSAALTAKNFLNGFSGEGIARERVMRGQGGWTEFCKAEVEAGRYDKSLNNCYLENADEIERDVETAKEAINDVNDNLERFEVANSESGLFGEQSIDDVATRIAYCKYLRETYGAGYLNCDERYVPTYGNLREIEFNNRIKGSSGRIGQSAGDALRDIEESVVEGNEAIDRVDEARERGKAVPITLNSVSTGRTLPADIRSTDDGEYSGFSGEEAYVRISAGSSKSGVILPKGFEEGEYVIGLNRDQRGAYVPQTLYKENGNNLEALEGKLGEFLSTYRVSEFVLDGKESYRNFYENAKVKYFDREPFKGLPAIVPFDRQNGWYAATKQSISGVLGDGTQKAYEESGRVSSFWICNVGLDGMESFNSNGRDDICTLVNRNSFGTVGTIADFSESESRDLYNRAVRAIEEAAKREGNKIVTIDGEDYQTEVAVSVPAVQCQDFMSPEDCHLMFNVCDPVICPNSRCDLGGAYPVADVVQTGIVGSALLCLPNIKEGIAVPVCLTGINAGIEGYVSILESHRDCLQENLETGRTVGICDEIYSVYMCEFFWRQVAPVAELLLPKLVESAYGQGTRGGGEYLTVMSAWDNLQGSVEYFTQSYATNSLKAFRARSVEEAGGEFCKGFVSVGVPTDFDSLIEPDSPTQFHAWFDSYPFNDVTVPKTDQYKVFYHIFAGNDVGVQYSVYLRGAPESSTFSVPATIQVDTGFITRGDKVTETKDFTAPAGYQELCVRINNQEECGFGEVSTSFAVNYLADKYVADEIDRRDIQEESECISGGVNLGALITNPNIQSGIEETVNPEIVEQGVVRVCSSRNPGSGEDVGRFIDVGYCGSEDVRCWLDSESVDRAISRNNEGLRNESLVKIQGDRLEQLQGAEYLLGDVEARSLLDKIRSDVKNLKSTEDTKVNEIYSKMNALEGRLVINLHKAELALERARLKGKVVLAKCRDAGICVQQSVPDGGGFGTGDSDSGNADNSEERRVVEEKVSDYFISSVTAYVSGPVQEVTLGKRFKVQVGGTCPSYVARVYNGEYKIEGDSRGGFFRSEEIVARGSATAGNDVVTIEVDCLNPDGDIIESKEGSFTLVSDVGPAPENQENIFASESDDFSNDNNCELYFSDDDGSRIESLVDLDDSPAYYATVENCESQFSDGNLQIKFYDENNNQFGKNSPLKNGDTLIIISQNSEISLDQSISLREGEFIVEIVSGSGSEISESLMVSKNDGKFYLGSS